MDITAAQMRQVEHYADRLFSEYKIDVNFQNLYKGTHFLDRVNDPRNGEPITINELNYIFMRFSQKYGSYLMKFYKNYPGNGNVEAIIKDMHSDINMPFILEWNDDKGELELRPKTIMRKHDFTSNGKVFAIEMKLKNLYEELIDEWQDAHGFEKLIPYLEDKLKIKIGKRIHSGTMSDIFDLGDKVLKITSTPHDAAGLYIGTQNPTYPIPKIFSLYRIDQKEVEKYNYHLTSRLSEKKLWVAIVEKVTPINPTENQIIKLESWFEENTNYICGDVTGENVGKDSKGRIVYLDPAFYNVESLSNKIPTLK